MEIACQSTDDGHTLLELTGRLDLTTCGSLRAAVTSSVEDGASAVILDLSHVNFIDSSGIGALVGSFRKAHDAGGALRIVAPLPEVLDVLTLMRVDRVLPPYPTMDAALEGL